MECENKLVEQHAVETPRSGPLPVPVWRRRLRRHLPITHWLPAYTLTTAISDAVAGLTLGLTMIPQSIAYAALAGLPAQYGLYSTFMGSFIYVLMGTVKEVSIGPTSLMALLTFEFTHHLPIEFIVLLTAAVGLIELLMGLFKLGILVDFISAPVTCGFQSATAAIIVASQLKGLLGLRKFKPGGFFDSVVMTGQKLWETRAGDATLGVVCCITLLMLRKLKDWKVGGKGSVARKMVWFVSISRNAIVVLGSSVVAYLYEQSGRDLFVLSGNMTGGLPPFQLPAFSAKVGNETYSLIEMLDEIKLGAAILPLVAVLANVTIAKAFCSGNMVDATQEMMTLGVCNMAGSLVSAMPTCGAFTRSAVSSSSGVRTPLAGAFSGCLILLVVSFLTPYFYYIPRASLAAVLICAVIFMFDYSTMRLLWRASKRDFVSCLATLMACLTAGVELGLLTGITINVCQLLYLWARPSVSITQVDSAGAGGPYYLVRPDIGLFFPAVDFVRSELHKHCTLHTLPVIVDCLHIKGIDFTCAQGIGELVSEFRAEGRTLLLINMAERVHKTLSAARVALPFLPTHTYATVHDALCSLTHSPSALLLSNHQPTLLA